MKKLSIEQKAKAYDELLLKLQKAKVDDNVCDEMYYRVIDNIVPELKESEDEKTRKELLSVVNDLVLPNEQQSRFVAWLEEQGDKDKLIKELGKYKVKYTQEVLEKHLNNMNNKDNENAVKCITWLKKQGEQKQDPCEHCDNVMLNCHNFPCIKKKAFEQGKSVFDIINEEKVDNANKVDPKFKAGDWVTIKE